ncbi:hypothetical protein CDL12_16548 [Handroanthus impetiginosus]|uniref:Retrotransposon gag domain-containing protein n=1 Tax=Handroanthus impetiginosus TaxID=429701 RepID=A0A2G9H002_9LAMI|nr:hypothetical protein CDL12_16548 [Handroanthus impetiginosus]
MARSEFENLSEGEESYAVPDSAAQPPPDAQPGNAAAQIDAAQLTELVAATVNAVLAGYGILPQARQANHEEQPRAPQNVQPSGAEPVPPTGHVRQATRVEERCLESYMSVEPSRNSTLPSLQRDVNSEMRAIRQEMEEMRRALKGVPETTVEGVAFDEDILAEPIPGNYRPPGIPEYHGTTDPALHLRRFQTAVLLYQYSDKLKCRVFANTFGEDAQLWFNQLPPRCIRSFSQFRDLFMHQFNSSKRFRKTSFTLYNVRQGDDESLRDYVRRFTAAVLEVPSLHKEVLANSFVNGLTEGPFFATLVTDPVENYDELLARAKKFINLEEAIKIKRADREKMKGKKEEVPAPNKPRPEGQEKNPSFTQQMDRFTPLRVPRSQVLMEIGATNLLKRPFRASQGPSKPKSDKFCQFHNDYGHDTDECAHLRNEIEKLIKKVYLREFVADVGSVPRSGGSNAAVGQTSALPQAPPRKEAISETSAHQRKGIIHMISEGPTTGDSNRSRKAHARRGPAKIPRLEVSAIEPGSIAPVIQFSSADLEGVDCPHQDALVITATVATYDVARVFVDCGSSVDILFLRAFQQMNLGPVKMEPVQTALVEFAGESVRPLGQTMLPLTLGRGVDAKTRMV